MLKVKSVAPSIAPKIRTAFKVACENTRCTLMQTADLRRRHFAIIVAAAAVEQPRIVVLHERLVSICLDIEPKIGWSDACSSGYGGFANGSEHRSVRHAQYRKIDAIAKESKEYGQEQQARSAWRETSVP